MKLTNENVPFSKRFIMSVDVDSWSSLLRFYSVNHNPEKTDIQVDVEDGIDKLLNLFEKHAVKATFFVPGDVAQKHSQMIRAIAEDGHEVACHGLHHDRNECLLGLEEQRAYIEKAVAILKNATGLKPLGFRAPCLRANDTTLRILDGMGCLYDSSFLPMFIPGTYGSLSFKFKPYYPFSKNRSLIEIPISTNPIAPLPLSGSWMRNLGLSWIKFGTKMLFDLGNPVMIYIHPRDVVSLPRMPNVPWHVYRKTGKACLKMLDELLGYVKLLRGRTIRAMDLALEEMKK
ncbi:polysaccharide deacetylase family protein [Candidatus Bathyarchaeota archaeon]|nr:polysaccharide deacetylase family protein [Candidatus Bathyarchaeota archaeon]